VREQRYRPTTIPTGIPANIIIIITVNILLLRFTAHPNNTIRQRHAESYTAHAAIISAAE